jgi:EAL domain-containing protein (putative c-di-GMP-specific phosphodiesterase class I)
VIAEGVETRAQADFLAAAGCLAVQGFYFAEPKAGAELESLLVAGRIEPTGVATG